MFGIYFLVGAFAGTLAGLFGIGGGVIIIPALAGIFLHNSLIPPEYVMHMAVGTSLGTVVVTASSSMYAHHKRLSVVWPMVRKMAPGLLIGVIVGSMIAQFLPSSFLRVFFSLFLVFIALRMVTKTPHESTKVLSEAVIRVGSFFMGVLSSILGVGGGVLMVPFFLHCHLDMRQATGTSVACGLAIGVVATICFLTAGLFAKVHLPQSTGYIYWPAFLGISAASILFAPFGVRLAHKLPREMLKKIFAVFLLMMAADMMFFTK
jgi:uncharacterized membrane protein YfcA